MSAKHTPGKWAVRNGTTHAHDITALSVRGKTWVIARVSAAKVSGDAAEANARLIAAAPELLTGLEHLVRLLEPLEQSGSLNVPGLSTLNGARAALAKARGEA